jgi:creatinine amidohydrolase
MKSPEFSSASHPPRPSEPGLLETMTVPEVKSFRSEVMVIPLGSTEPHGPHLPYGTDTTVANRYSREAVRRANAEGARVMCLPAMPFGNNVNFKDFPFACRIRVETLMAVVLDLVTFGREEGVRKFVLVNGHGGNDSTLAASTRQIFDRFQNEVFVGLCGPGAFGGEIYQKLFSDGSPHAGEYETSLMQFLAPEKMPAQAPAKSAMYTPTVPGLAEAKITWVRNWASLMPAACGGRPDLATPEKGEEFFEADVTGFSRFLVALSQAPWHSRFPYEAEGA